MDTGSDNPEGRDVPRSPGAILADERERQGLARADIAQRLHMSVSQVEALEAADYERLPRGTFLRGFTRNYARSLGLDADAVVGLLADDAPRETAPDIVVPTQNIRFDPLGQRLANPYVKAAGVAFVLVVLGFAAMYWWLFIRPHGPVQPTAVKKPAIEAPKVEPVAPAPEAPATAAAPASAAVAQPSTAASPAAMTMAATPAAVPPAPVPAAEEAPRVAAPGEGTIRLAFRGAAWVEITDARGKVLLSRTHPGGSSAETIGKPPFNLVIGNAPEVRLTFNGREVDLAPHTRVAVARLTLP
ncbi:MAG: helix-turn-helix domain-containing protein [Betaproteobacteria bacterium]|nr:helix-turn-helix domain-containing protein [Betaproteobacteria bacterium]